jgi:hypothetical protein
MMLFRNSSRIRVAAVGVLVWTALLALSVGSGTAEARNSGCRTDPVVVLTNGAQLQFGANIGTAYSNVESVVYVIHGPVGSAPLLVLYTDNPLGSVERVEYHGDGPARTYTIDTVVYLESGSATVSTSSLLINLLHLTLGRATGNGMDNQHIFMSMSY